MWSPIDIFTTWMFSVSMSIANRLLRKGVDAWIFYCSWISLHFLPAYVHANEFYGVCNFEEESDALSTVEPHN